jgi:pimeloyl-ACP methyl ester carboxylesterase
MSASTQSLPTPILARTVRGSGPGLLLAHGAGGSVDANYGPVLDRLAASRTVVGPDYPGTGATPRSAGPLDADDLADQLVAAAVAEGLETFALSGFSLGGPVAVRAAARHPERVTALVLTATFAQADARLRLACSVWRRAFETGDARLLAEYLLYVALSVPALEGLSPEQFEEVATLTASSLAPGTPEHTDLVARIDVRDDLARIAVPTLVIRTDADPLVAPDLQDRLAEGIPGARVVGLATGHLPMAERAEEWGGLLADFLAGV